MDLLPFDVVQVVDVVEIFRSEPGWHWRCCLPGHYYNIWIVLEGKGVLVCDGIAHTLQPGSAFVLGPGQNVEATQDPEHRIRNFAAHVMPYKKGRPLQAGNLFPVSNVRMVEQGWIESLCKAAVRQHQLGDPLGQQQCEALLMHILAEVARAQLSPGLSSTEQRLAQLLTSINEESYVWRTLEEMANSVHLSKTQLNRLFKRRTGYTPLEYAIQARMRRAAHMLVNSDLRIGEVAEAMGYQDIYFFSRQFARYHGCSPSVYRNQPA